jgi:LacI family transcriptional regulator
MPDRKRITLKDIARELGISISTASRALNSYAGISEDTIKMVKEFAEKHNYVPNAMAVNFRKNKTMTIGMVVPELVHYFFSSVISGAIKEAKKHHYSILVSQSDESHKNEIIACRTMLSSSVDGLLISISNETEDADHLQEFLDEGRPVVQFDKVTDQINSPKVIVDDFQGAYTAVEHLILQGYRKIAHINGLRHVKNSAERLRGYKKALSDNGIEINSDWIMHCKDISEKEGFDFAKQLNSLDNPPDAVFFITDLVAMGAMKYFKQAKVEVPRQMGLVGFSNWDMANLVSPSLSSVDQHAFQMGEKAVELLIAAIKASEVGKEEVYEIKTSLITRESSDKLQELF